MLPLFNHISHITTGLTHGHLLCAFYHRDNLHKSTPLEPCLSPLSDVAVDESFTTDKLTAFIM